MAPSKLTKYRSKRDFTRTAEPAGQEDGAAGNLFMVHKHDATRLHYDLRLQVGDVLKSWAVPKGPSLDPGERRLAVEVEDHPLDYGGFEGVIAEGQYGAGPTLIWDSGTWAPMGDLEKSLESGTLKFRLAGEKLKGGWTLARMKRREGETRDNWLLIKEDDDAASTDIDVLEERPESVVSGRTIEDLDGESAPARKRVRLRPGALTGAVKAPLPKSYKPQLATAVTEPPAGDSWLHEIKFDGYRTIAVVAGGEARLLTRNGHDWTKRYGELAHAFADLDCREAVIDGEVVVLDDQGISRFGALQDALANGESWRFVFYAFDIMHLNGWDLVKVPLTKRKDLLKKLVSPVVGANSAIQLSEHVAGQGAKFFDEASDHGLEGIVSKRADSTYIQGRSKTWLKAKAKQRGVFTIVGFTTSRAAGGLAALLLAEERDGDLTYCGKVGTGFSSAEAGMLAERLGDLEVEAPAVDVPGPRPKAVWVKPTMKARVQYAHRAREGGLMHPVFKGLRETELSRSGAVAPTKQQTPQKHLD